MEINVKEFIDLLWSENSRQNLISRKLDKQDIYKHIEDSLILTDYMNLNKMEVIDIGSGAGFPGLILAAAFKEAKFTLVEADLKKSGFLEKAVEQMSLHNVKVIRQRVEVLGQDKEYRGRYDFCTSRAVAAMNVMLEYGIPFLKQNGRLCMWKGKNFRIEIDEAENALQELQARVDKVIQYQLENEKKRALILVQTQGICPPRYPRRNGIPLKRPL